MKEHFKDLTKEEIAEACERLDILPNTLRRRIAQWGMRKALTQSKMDSAARTKHAKETGFLDYTRSKKKRSAIGFVTPDEATFGRNRKKTDELIEQRRLEQCLRDVWFEE